MYHYCNVHLLQSLRERPKQVYLLDQIMGFLMMYAFVVNVMVSSCHVVVLLLQYDHSLPKILLLPILKLAFSFFLISGESDALLINRNGVNGLESVSPACRGDESSRSGLAARFEAVDGTRDRTGVTGFVEVSSSWLVNDSLDILCPIELLICAVVSVKWSAKKLRSSAASLYTDSRRQFHPSTSYTNHHHLTSEDAAVT